MKWISDAAVDRLRAGVEAPQPDRSVAGGRYRVGKLLGRGGMGAVYLARDGELQRDVALKVLPLAAGDDPRAARRLRREAKILALLEHPGIVPVHDLGLLPDGRVFYVMKRVDGRRLDQVVAGRPATAADEAERLRLFLRLCEAVAFAHDRGVVHRDLKPENVMVGSFGEVLVMDWGVAKLLAEAEQPSQVEAVDERDAASAADGATAWGTVLGTPGYMAPEQSRGEVGRQDQRADVYALGALLCYLLTGAPPADGAAPPGAPKPLAAVMDKALAAQPEARYGGVDALAAEISSYLAGLPVRAHREGVVDRLRRWLRRYRLAIGLVVAYLLMRFLFLLLAGV